jgi:hypothetical protein
MELAKESFHFDGGSTVVGLKGIIKALWSNAGEDYQESQKRFTNPDGER